MDLTKECISWKLHDIAHEIVDSYDQSGGKDFPATRLLFLFDLVNQRYQEVRELREIYPDSLIVRHNFEVLSLTAVLLKMSLMSKPFDAS